MRTIQIVFANYHCSEKIVECLRSIVFNSDELCIHVVIVNNDGSNFCIDNALMNNCIRFSSENPETNAGYFGAFRFAKNEDENGIEFDYRILSNPDIQFSPNFFNQLMCLKLEDDVAMVAPKIVSEKLNSNQNPYMKNPPTRWRYLVWYIVYSHLFLLVAYEWLADKVKKMKASRSLHEGGMDESCYIYAPHGSLLILKGKVIKNLHGLEEVPFLYSEELFLGEICRRQGLKIIYQPSLCVKHEEHATTAGLHASWRFKKLRDGVRKYLNWMSCKPC